MVVWVVTEIADNTRRNLIDKAAAGPVTDLASCYDASIMGLSAPREHYKRLLLQAIFEDVDTAMETIRMVLLGSMKPENELVLCSLKERNYRFKKARVYGQMHLNARNANSIGDTMVRDLLFLKLSWKNWG